MTTTSKSNANLDIGHSLLDIGHFLGHWTFPWTLEIPCWTLDISLDIGHFLGYWTFKTDIHHMAQF